MKLKKLIMTLENDSRKRFWNNVERTEELENKEFSSLTDALNALFSWKNTPEGHLYWGMRAGGLTTELLKDQLVEEKTLKVSPEIIRAFVVEDKIEVTTLSRYVKKYLHKEAKVLVTEEGCFIVLD